MGALPELEQNLELSYDTPVEARTQLAEWLEVGWNCSQQQYNYGTSVWDLRVLRQIFVAVCSECCFLNFMGYAGHASAESYRTSYAHRLVTHSSGLDVHWFGYE